MNTSNLSSIPTPLLLEALRRNAEGVQVGLPLTFYYFPTVTATASVGDIQREYKKRIQEVQRDEEKRVGLERVDDERLYRAMNDRQSAAKHHCFVVKNYYGETEVVTATYVEIADELMHRDKTSVLDSLRQLPTRVLEQIADRVVKYDLQSISYTCELGNYDDPRKIKPVEWTREQILKEASRRCLPPVR